MPTKNPRNSRQGDAVTGDDVPIMVDIYSSVNFFKNFGGNVLLGKNTLKTRKRLLSDDHTGKQGLVPRLL